MKRYNCLILFLGVLLSSFNVSSQDWGLVNSFNDPTATTQFTETGASVAVDGNVAVVGSPVNNGSIGTAYVYEKQSGSWVHVATLNPGSLLTEIEDFGRAVDIEGETIVVGAPIHNNFGDGAVYIFEKPVSGWSGTLTETIRLDSPTPYGQGLFGQSLDLNGDELLVGAPFENIDLGRAHLFSKSSGSSWTTAAHIATFDHAVASNDLLGEAVALTDEIAVLGASGSGANAGNVFIYEKGAAWTSKASADAVLRKSNRSSAENYGAYLTAKDDRIVVGMRATSVSNSVFVYHKPVSGWSAEYVANGTIEETYAIGSEDIGFGFALDLEDDRLAIGHPQKTNGTFGNNGSAYLYELGASSATQELVIDPEDLGTNVFFGSAVALSGGELVIGARQANVSGRVHFYFGEYTTNLNEFLCFGQTFDFDGQTLSTSGTYNKSFTSTDNLDSLVTVNLTVNPQLNFAFNLDPILCNGETGGITFDSPSGGDGGPYEYSVDGVNFQTSPTFSGLSSVPLTLVLRDGTGCTRTEGVMLQEPAEVLITSTSVTDPNCFSTNDGSITLQVTGGSAGYYYSLDAVNYTFNGAGINTSVTIGSLVPGTYSVYIKDGNDCETTTSATLTGPSQISMSATTSDPLCNGESNGSITNILAGGGNGGPFTYSLDGTNFQAANSFTNLAAGTYILTVQDNSGCFFGQTFTLANPSEIAPSVTITNSTSCSSPDGSIDISTSGGVGPYTYALDGSPTTLPITGLAGGTYSIKITDANGCSTTISESVSEPAAPIVAANFDDPTCFGANDGTISAVGFNGVAPYEYSFDGGAFSSTQTASGLGPGNHTVDVRDANGCIGSTTVFLIEPSQLTISNATGTDLSCHQGGNGSIDITMSGGTPIYTYSFDGTNFNNFDTQTSVVINDLDAGTYNITVRDLNGCVVSTTVTLTEPPVFDFSATISNVSCNAESDGAVSSIVPSGGNGAPYLYSIDGVNYQSTASFSGLVAGQVTVYVQDANGCEISKTETISEPTAISPTVTKVETSTCGATDGQLDVTANGGVGPYTFALNGGSGQVSGTFSGLGSGVYSIDITDATGCVTTINEVISDPVTATITTSTTDAFCDGSMDGSITISVAGGTAPYEYSLDGGAFQTSNEFSNLDGGSYSVSVKEANGCIQTVTANVNEPDPSLPVVGTSNYTTTYGSSFSSWSLSFNAADMVSSHLYIDNIQGSGLSFSSTPITSDLYITPSSLANLIFDPQTVGTITFDVQAIVGTTTLACLSGSPLTITVAVDPVTVNVTADNKSRKYGEANPALTFAYSGFVNGEDENVLTNSPSISTQATVGSAVGNYAINVSGASADNYDFNYVDGTFSVTEADLVVTANDQQVTFGETAQLDGTITGIENGDNITADYSTVATATSDAGTYAITASLVDPDGKLGNYNVTNNSGTLTIVKADQAISFAAIDDIDLLNASSATLNATSDVGLQVTFSITQGQSIASISGNVISVTGTGNVTVEASQVGNTNYNPASATESFSVIDSRKTNQTITFAAIADKTYGDAAFSLGATSSSSLSVEYTLTGPATLNGNEVTITGVGQVTVTADQNGDNTFNPAPSVSQSFEILRASLVVEANDQSMVYGDQVPGLDGSISGIAYNDNLTVSYSTSGDGTEAGDFSIEAAINDPDSKLSNYSVSNTAGTLTVAKAELSVVANDYELAFGEAIPTLEGVVTGIKNSDNISANYTTLATTTSDVGDYEVEIDLMDPDTRLGNYTVTKTNGTLTIVKADQSITFDAINSIDIATTNTVSLVANTSSGLAVTFTLTEGDGTIAGSTLTVNSSGNFSVRAVQEGNSNYNAAVEVTQSFQVTDSRKLNQTITFEALSVRSYGDVFSLAATASSELPVTYSSTGPASISGSDVTITGVGEVTITASQTGDNEYNPAVDVSQSFTSEKAELTATADDKIISEGDAIPELTVSYSGFVNDEDASVLDAEPDLTTSATATSETGEYTIVLTGGSDENYEFALVNGTLAIEEVLGFDDDSSVEIYPNPFTDQFTVDGAEIAIIEIRDLSGKVLYKTKERKIDASEWNAGVYLVVLKDNEAKIIGQMRVKKND